MELSRLPGRRIAFTLCAGTGGLLSATFLSAAAAFADDYIIDPTGPVTITGIYGYALAGSASPAAPGSIQADQNFDYTNTTTGSGGEFAGFENSWTDTLGDVNQEVYVASDVAGTGAPSVGSVFDTYTFGDGSFASVYVDIYSPSGDTVTDTLDTPFGDFSFPKAFDAVDLAGADAGGVPMSLGYDIDPLGSPVITAVTGVPPVFVVNQGSQNFDVVNDEGTETGSFAAFVTPTADTFGIQTEAVLVTNDLVDSDVGTAAGDTPAVGSIFNTTALGGFANDYSDLVGTSGGANVYIDTLVTPFGQFEIPDTFDAAKAETTSVMNLLDGEHFDPIGKLTDTGVNGLPPVDVAVQGTQGFEIDGSPTDTFTADVTNTLDEFGDSSETILITSSSDLAVPVGSVYEVAGFGNTGFEYVYTDIVSASGGADVISDTFVTPFGDITIPTTLDLAASTFTDVLGGL
jgi:hypothetical protein